MHRPRPSRDPHDSSISVISISASEYLHLKTNTNALERTQHQLFEAAAKIKELEQKAIGAGPPPDETTIVPTHITRKQLHYMSGKLEGKNRDIIFRTFLTVINTVGGTVLPYVTYDTWKAPGCVRGRHYVAMAGFHQKPHPTVEPPIGIPILESAERCRDTFPQTKTLVTSDQQNKTSFSDDHSIRCPIKSHHKTQATNASNDNSSDITSAAMALLSIQETAQDCSMEAHQVAVVATRKAAMVAARKAALAATVASNAAMVASARVDFFVGRAVAVSKAAMVAVLASSAAATTAASATVFVVKALAKRNAAMAAVLAAYAAANMAASAIVFVGRAVTTCNAVATRMAALAATVAADAASVASTRSEVFVGRAAEVRNAATAASTRAAMAAADAARFDAHRAGIFVALAVAVRHSTIVTAAMVARKASIIATARVETCMAVVVAARAALVAVTAAKSANRNIRAIEGFLTMIDLSSDDHGLHTTLEPSSDFADECILTPPGSPDDEGILEGSSDDEGILSPPGSPDDEGIMAYDEGDSDDEGTDVWLVIMHHYQTRLEFIMASTNKMLVRELRAELKKRRLITTGLKGVLVRRLSYNKYETETDYPTDCLWNNCYGAKSYPPSDSDIYDYLNVVAVPVRWKLSMDRENNWKSISRRLHLLFGGIGTDYNLVTTAKDLEKELMFTNCVESMYHKELRWVFASLDLRTSYIYIFALPAHIIYYILELSCTLIVYFAMNVVRRDTFKFDRSGYLYRDMVSSNIVRGRKLAILKDTVEAIQLVGSVRTSKRKKKLHVDPCVARTRPQRKRRSVIRLQYYAPGEPISDDVNVFLQ